LKVKEGVHYSNKGVLLRFDKESFSLYHPILSLNDVSLESLLSCPQDFTDLLDKAEKTSISKKDLAALKAHHVDVYYSAPSVNAFLKAAERLVEMDFKIVKLKFKSLSEIDFEKLEQSVFEFIFDFNGQEKFESFEKLSLAQKEFIKNRVLYIEDPYKEIENVEKYDFFKLASDFLNYDCGEDFKVVKPTGFNHEILLDKSQKTVVTSYLDHPLGQIVAAKWAFENSVNQACGLYSHTYYTENKYSKLFKEQNKISFDVLEPFLDLLAEEKWQKLV
jgi:hypothetical protein